MGRSLSAPGIEEVRAARARIADGALRTPLVRFTGDSDGIEVFLKLENLQPIGSFKIRGALNKMLALPRARLADGVYTASAGNMAQGVAWAARHLGVAATSIVPDNAPRAKLDAIDRLGARAVPVPFDEWWAAMENHGRPGMTGTFIHPFADRDVMAGNGTIAAEILDDCPDVDTVVVPWGGGGLACGIASAMRVLRPAVSVYAAEIEGSAPLAASLAAGRSMTIDSRRTFVDGIGGRSVMEEIWPLAREFIAGSWVATVDDAAESVRALVQYGRVVAEGAGAAALAAIRRRARDLEPRPKRVVCIVSGGNINPSALATILSGSTP